MLLLRPKLYVTTKHWKIIFVPWDGVEKKYRLESLHTCLRIHGQWKYHFYDGPKKKQSANGNGTRRTEIRTHAVRTVLRKQPGSDGVGHGTVFNTQKPARPVERTVGQSCCPGTRRPVVNGQIISRAVQKTFERLARCRYFVFPRVESRAARLPSAIANLRVIAGQRKRPVFPASRGRRRRPGIERIHRGRRERVASYGNPVTSVVVTSRLTDVLIIRSPGNTRNVVSRNIVMSEEMHSTALVTTTRVSSHHRLTNRFSVPSETRCNRIRNVTGPRRVYIEL